MIVTRCALAQVSVLQGSKQFDHFIFSSVSLKRDIDHADVFSVSVAIVEKCIVCVIFLSFAEIVYCHQYLQT